MLTAITLAFYSEAFVLPQFSGRFGPTQMSASGSGPPPIIMPGESLIVVGIVSAECAMPASVNERRSALTTTSDWPMILMFQKMARENTRGSGSTLHKTLPAWVFASPNTPSIWLARNNASGSFAGQDKVTEPPAVLAREAAKRVLTSGARILHLAACSTRAAWAFASAAFWSASRARSSAPAISRAASSLYASNSALVLVDSSRWRTTTHAVLRTTAMAASAAQANDQIITCSQECKSRPSTRLALKVVTGLAPLSAILIVAVAV